MARVFDETIHCSLVKFENNTGTKIKEEEQLAYCREAGLDFIWLKHTIGYLKMKISIRSFQRATVYLSQSRGKLDLEIEYDIDRKGKPRRGGQLWFMPDKMGMLKAPLMLTEINYNILVDSYFSFNRQWNIADPQIDAEVKAKAIALGHDKIPQPKQVEQTRRSAQSENEELKEKYNASMMMLRIMEDKERLRNEGATPAASEPVAKTETAGGNGSSDIDAEILKEIEKRARKEVYRDKADILNEIKKGTPKGWAFTPRFRKEISPEIKQLTERYKLEYTGASNNS